MGGLHAEPDGGPGQTVGVVPRGAAQTQQEAGGDGATAPGSFHIPRNCGGGEILILAFQCARCAPSNLDWIVFPLAEMFILPKILRDPFVIHQRTGEGGGGHLALFI